MKIIDIQPQQPDLVDIEARGRLSEVNRIYFEMRQAHQNEYRTFWYRPDTSLRTVEEINAVLAKMDELTPLGSTQYFGRAWSLVQFLLASEESSALSAQEKMQTSDYLPPLALVETSEGGRRVQA